MNSREYWQKRYLQIAAANQHRTSDYEREMMAQVDSIHQAAQRDIEAFYNRYARVDGTSYEDAAETLKNVRGQGWQMTLEEFERKARLGGYDDELDLQYIRSRVARLQQLQVQLVKSVSPAVPGVIDGMSEEMKRQYQTTYEHAMYLNEAVTGVTGNFAAYDQQALETVVAKPWRGSNFSQRIWGQMTEKLPNLLVQEVAEALVLGTSPKDLTRSIASRFVDFKRSDLHRLVTTEMAHIDEQATFQSYRDCGAEYYEYMATLEARTCETCGHLDGKHFPVAEQVEGGNYPPIHPYCRCTTAIWEPDMPEPKQRWMRDPITGKGKRVPMQTFDEWRAGKERVTADVDDELQQSIIGAQKAFDKTNFASAFGKDKLDKFKTYIAGVKDKVLLKAYARYGGDINFIKGNSSFYRMGSVMLKDDAFEGSFGSTQYQTVFHEIGHAVDAAGAQALHGGFVDTGTVQKATRGLAKGKMVPVSVAQLSGSKDYNLGATISNDLYRFVNDEDMPTVGPRPRKKAEKTEWEATRDRYVDGMRKLNQYVIDTKPAAKDNPNAYQDASDIIEGSGLVQGEFPWYGGHGTRYWRNVGNRETEFVAEYTSAKAANPESYETLKKMFPNACAIVDKMLKEMTD